ncbi:MAG TPA: ATP cone domain-containing protein [Gemmataceae bacterium]|nr:ATP cone domain-containing protein [Gemmataceae bacterium]
MRGPNGRSEPFEPERITRRLFAVTERVGHPDAFLARELTDGVLHFLNSDTVGPNPTPSQIAEVVVKVVRELGQPALASAYEESVGLPPGGLLPESLNEPSDARIGPSQIFPRDLVSAHEEGLIRLTGLESPRELAGVLTHLPLGGIRHAVRHAREIAGEYLAIDGPEFDLAAMPGDPIQLADEFLQEARSAAVAAGLTLILNLNIALPPARMSEGAGPLFQPGAGKESDRHRQIARALGERAHDGPLAIWWHVTADNAKHNMPAERLLRNSTEFVFDRDRAPIQLGPGIDRQTPATLIEVGVNLARLVELTGGLPVDPEVFLRRVGSLARFAKTAGHVKHDYLRRHGAAAVREAFLLDRARLVLVPIGLADAARAANGPPAEFARDILRTLRTAAEGDRPRVMPVRIDSPLGDDEWGAVADPDFSMRQQIRRASQLHAVTGAGRVDLVVNGTNGDRAEALRLAAESSVVRLRFRPS